MTKQPQFKRRLVSRISEESRKIVPTKRKNRSVSTFPEKTNGGNYGPNLKSTQFRHRVECTFKYHNSIKLGAYMGQDTMQAVNP